MSDPAVEPDEEVRRRVVAVFGGSKEAIADHPIEELRKIVAAIDQQVDDYEALGFMTPDEADQAAAR